MIGNAGKSTENAEEEEYGNSEQSPKIEARGDVITISGTTSSNGSDIIQRILGEEKQSNKFLRFCEQLWSLRCFIFLLTTGSVFATGLIVWVLGMAFNVSDIRASSDNLASILIKDTGQATTEIIKAQVVISSVINGYLHQAEKSFGGLDAEDEEFQMNVSRFLWDLLISTSGGSGTKWIGYVGFRESGMLLLAALTTQVVLISKPFNGSSEYYLFQYAVNTTSDELENVGRYTRPYNLFERDWYILASEMNETVHAQVPMFISRGQLSATSCVVLPYISRNTNQFEAAINVCLSMKELQIWLSETGEYVVVFQEDGTVVGDSVTRYSTGNNNLFSLHESNVTFVKVLGEFILEEYGAYENLPLSAVIRTNVDKFMIRFSFVKEEGSGIGNFVAVAFETRELYRGVKAVAVYSMLVSLSVVILMSFISFILSLLLSTQINRIIDHLISIASLEKTKKRYKNNLLRFKELNNADQAMKVLIHGFENFKKFIPGYVIQFLVDERVGDVKYKLIALPVSIQFADICGFTSMCERLPPTDLVRILKTFFEICERKVQKFGGTIDKFLGDGVMSLYNAPRKLRNHEVACVYSAIEIYKSVDEVFEMFTEDIQIGIGINTDRVLTGFVGTNDRLTYTALGDGVNTASRIEGKNKLFGSKILIGEQTYKKVKATFNCRFLARESIRGKANKVNIYEVLLHDSKKDEDQVSGLSEIKIHLEKEELQLAEEKMEEVVRKSKENSCDVGPLEKSLERMKKVFNTSIK